MNALRHFLLALQFFTRIPVTGRLAAWVGYSPLMLRNSAGHFPGIGLLLGMMGAAVLVIFSHYFATLAGGTFISATLSTAFTVWVTGAFHEDGLADTADGLGGHVDRARALAIMKDSRIGTYGAVTLVLALLLKCLLLGALGTIDVCLASGALLLGHTLSRGLSLVIIATLPHVGEIDGSKSKPLADQISGRSLLTGTLWSVAGVAAGAWLLYLGGPASALTRIAAGLTGAALACAWMWRLLAKRLEGFTGDGLGATQQAAELLLYLGVALAA